MVYVALQVLHKFNLTFINSDNLDPQLVHFNEGVP